MEEKLKELKTAAKLLYKEIPVNYWSYDNGITDDETGERGKPPMIETISNGKHTLIASLMSEDEVINDFIGGYLKLVDPKTILTLIKKIEDLEYAISKIQSAIGELHSTFL